QPWAEGAGRRKILAGGELSRVTLPVADAAVIVAAVSRDMGQGVPPRNPAACFPDHDGQLALEVELFRFGGPNHCLTITDLALCEPHENHRIGRLLAAGFAQMRLVVHPD